MECILDWEAFITFSSRQFRQPDERYCSKFYPCHIDLHPTHSSNWIAKNCQVITDSHTNSAKIIRPTFSSKCSGDIWYIFYLFWDTGSIFTIEDGKWFLDGYSWRDFDFNLQEVKLVLIFSPVLFLKHEMDLQTFYLCYFNDIRPCHGQLLM